MKEASNPEQKNIPKWLNKIQLNSWEIELLISALVLYALFEIPESIKLFILENIPPGSAFSYLGDVILSALGLLRLGFMLHIIIRGFWVANVGLSYVFPNGIQSDALKFKGSFNKELKSHESLVNNVLWLEKLSSLIYGIFFMLFGIFLGAASLFILFMLLGNLINDLSNNAIAATGAISVLILAFLGLTVFFDFLTNGLLRRWKWSARIFYPIALAFRVLTFSFLYRKSLLILISNLGGWKSYLVPILIIATIFSYILINDEITDTKKEKYYSLTRDGISLKSNYENLRGKKDPLVATIPSDIVTLGVMKLFIADQRIFRSMLVAGSDFDETDSWHELDPKTQLQFINNWVLIRLDTQVLGTANWHRYQHPQSLQRGFISYLDLASLNRGEHLLTIDLDTLQLEQGQINIAKNTIQGERLASIRFFYDK